jgi:hypothetical protein
MRDEIDMRKAPLRGRTLDLVAQSLGVILDLLSHAWRSLLSLRDPAGAKHAAAPPDIDSGSTLLKDSLVSSPFFPASKRKRRLAINDLIVTLQHRNNTVPVFRDEDHCRTQLEGERRCAPPARRWR